MLIRIAYHLLDMVEMSCRPHKPSKLSHLKETGAAILDLDVSSSPEVIKSKIDEAWSIYDGIDVVVNNAGYILSGAVEELT